MTQRGGSGCAGCARSDWWSAFRSLDPDFGPGARLPAAYDGWSDARVSVLPVLSAGDAQRLALELGHCLHDFILGAQLGLCSLFRAQVGGVTLALCVADAQGLRCLHGAMGARGRALSREEVQELGPWMEALELLEDFDLPLSLGPYE